ncbi:MAG: hypothetical protein KatS3mg110_1728 [Pirellulaceae bacterium]|nr:MAG: hypothetical protein KatS3mg110_1728 [Pirellulaceae bacterium]
MKIGRRWGWLATVVAMASWFLPRPALAVMPGGHRIEATSKSTVDVQLQDGGILTGYVVTADGQPVALVPVRISRHGKLVAAAQTDVHGKFAVRDIRGGVYQIETPQQTDVVRLWAARTAPPSASDRLVMVVQSDDLIRAQGGGRFMQFITNPWVLGGIVAAAIAIPLALDDDDNAG